MKKIIYLLIIFGFIIATNSCSKLYDWNEQEEPEIQHSSIWPLSGEWYVVYRFDNGTGVIDDHNGVGHVKLFTTNTANNDANKFWISDGGNISKTNSNFWNYSVKADCNIGTKSFSGTDLVNTAIASDTLYNININITNGKVIVGGGKSPSGVVADSIYFEISFEDDNPSDRIYQCSGIRRTGFLEDEY